MPLLANLGFSIGKLKELGMWPREEEVGEEDVAASEDDGEIEEAFKSSFSEAGRHPSSIDNLPKKE